MPKCNSEKYSTDEYCGLISSNYSPWSLCLQVYTRHDFKTRTIFKFYILQKLPKAMNEKLFESCVYDMCQFQLNSLQQQKSKCDNYERLSQACYDIGITNFEWRSKANCRKIILFL